MSTVTLKGYFLQAAHGFNFGDSASVTWAFDQTTNTLSATAAAGGVSGLAEAIDDEVAALIQNGTGISWTYNDGANTLTPAVTLSPFTTANLTEGANLYFTDERAQDAVGTILSDTSSIDFTYNDGAPSISAVVLPAGVNHDALLNYVADQHVAHSGVTLTAGAGLTGGGDISASRTFAVGAGTGITVNADDVAIAAAYLGANPSASVGLAAVNGSSTNYMRADGAPALSQAIIPTWTETHTWTDNDEVRLGTGGDLRLYHDGTNSFIRNDTGNLLTLIGANTVLTLTTAGLSLTDSSASGGFLAVSADNTKTADFRMQQGGVNRWIFRKSGSSETGSNVGSDFVIVRRADDGSQIQNSLQIARSTGAWSFGDATTNPPYTFLGTGLSTFGGSVTLNTDNAQLRLGASTDLTLTHDGTNSIIDNNTGLLRILGATSGEIIVNTTGALYGTALHNNAGAVTGATNQYVVSGTYTPTLTNVTNVTVSTARQCTWMRVGNMVTVAGQVDVDPTAAGATELGISLPIASALTTAFQLGGTANSNVAAGEEAMIDADATNDRARIRWTAVDVTNHTYAFIFGYEVL